MINLGTIRPGTTIRIPFDTFALSTGAPTALSNFAVGDILIYKDSSVTERASTTGYTATTTFDSLTGLNEIIIDLSSDATGDFFKAGSRYYVGISPVTADGQTMTFWAAIFDIGYPNAVLNTSIATLASQTSFTLTTGPAEDDALNGMWAIVHDKASAVQLTWVQILDYTGSTKTVTLSASPAATFTIAAIDNFCVMGVMPLQPTVIGTFLDVSATGEAGVDWANVGGKTTSNALTNTTVGLLTTAVQAIWDALTSALTTVGSVGKLIADTLATVVASPANFSSLSIDSSGRVKSDLDTIKTQTVTCAGGVTVPAATLASTTNITAGTVTTATNVTTVNGLAAGVVTAAAIADNAIDRATFAADTGLQTIRSNTATAGGATSITLDGSASAVDSFYVNTLIRITGGTGAGQARFITAYTGATKVATVTAWVTNPDNTSTFAIIAFDAIPGATAPTASQVATAVWQDLLAGTDFSTAASIGKLLKDDIDAAISTRTKPADTQAAVTTVTNLTNAPTAGDFTATMKTSIGTAVAASPVASVTANVNADVAAINGSTAAAVRLALSAGVIIPGTVTTAGFAATTTEFEASDITTAAADHYKGRVILFTSGTLIGQATSISAYSLSGGRGHFTVVALTSAPANGVTFVVV